MSQRQIRQITAVIAAIALALVSLYKNQPQHVVSTSDRNSGAIVAATSSDQNWYPVKKVVDGDTLKIVMGGKVVTLRLIGLDTPEIVDPRKPVQCFAREASDEAKKILTGQSIRIEQDPSQGTYDKYGRLLAYVYAPANSVQEGILVNKYMISEGYGHEYTYDLPYKYQKEFKAAETEARISQKGLWAPGRCGL